MKVVGVHKLSASITEMTSVTSITADDNYITVTGILAGQTTVSTQSFPRESWFVRILES